MERIDFGVGIFTIKEFLSDEECGRYVKQSEGMGYEEAVIETAQGPELLKDVRNNDRVVFDDTELASRLFARARPFLPERMEDWRLLGFSERFRFYRYGREQFFKWHKDGHFCRTDDEISQLSFLMYLNVDYEGGETQFPWETIKPETGMALVFPHKIRHQGAPIISGVKYVLRTDVMFARDLFWPASA